MDVILFSVLGVAALAGLAFLLTCMEELRSRKWKSRLKKFRKLTRHTNTSSPTGNGELLFTTR